MSRRSLSTPAFSVVAACALLLSACGEQTPGGSPAEEQPQTTAGASAAGSTTTGSITTGSTTTEPRAAGSGSAEPGAAPGEDSDADDPIVVQIGEQEFPTIMAIYRRYDDAKGGPLALKAPVGPAEPWADGMTQDYLDGAVFWSPETGAQIVRGRILETYLEGGGPSGPLGWPTSDETAEGEVISSDFQRGQIRLENQTIEVVDHGG
ncbi:hypothetical protein [Dietzia sp. PP-33]|jgi:uncharacterized protein with LGFP repeats|uniref:LGFP repeat-containing protein n=1 Tax=Dietzia sp. PP-33 TaxID=2957500 RepID=UPI0029A021FB|nr:hypothetical protein [Dietzia sp. PP-33]MDX2355848.1 hypothetical protein [Dietzia sp. PP-33]